jgi:hypothetical protein
MRIEHWPVLLGSLGLALVVGGTASAWENPPAGTRSPAGLVWNETEGAEENHSNPWESGEWSDHGETDQVAHETPVEPMPADQPTFAAPQESWTDWTEGYDASEAWDDDEFQHDRRWYAGTELLLAWGLNPGNSLIGSADFRNLYFFPQAPNSFPHQSTGVFPNQFHYGVRARVGWDNPDDSGVMISGFYVFQNEQKRGPGRVFWGSDIYQLQPLASIPLNDGANGTVVPFDSAFVQKYNQSLYGGDIDAYFAPFFSRPSFQMKWLIGAKYLQIAEQFNVVAGDSGLGYTVNTTDNTIDYSTVQYIGIAPYQMSLNSNTINRLVGPSIGVRYDLGNQLIKVWGQTKFAVAANFSESELSGANVVNGFQAQAQQGPPFSQNDNTTRVSTVFETSVYADFHLFSALPLLHNVEFLRAAQLRIGFDYLLAGDVQRPTNTINYNTPTPSLKGNRTWFDMKTLSLGINWTY